MCDGGPWESQVFLLKSQCMDLPANELSLSSSAAVAAQKMSGKLWGKTELSGSGHPAQVTRDTMLLGPPVYSTETGKPSSPA